MLVLVLDLINRRDLTMRHLTIKGTFWIRESLALNKYWLHGDIHDVIREQKKILQNFIWKCLRVPRHTLGCIKIDDRFISHIYSINNIFQKMQRQKWEARMNGTDEAVWRHQKNNTHVRKLLFLGSSNPMHVFVTRTKTTVTFCLSKSFSR